MDNTINKKTKKVSIITTNYNCVSKNAKTLFYEMFRSIHEQDYPNIEHVIIDGGSEDGSVEFIKEIINKYAKKEVIFISEKDRGINDATNKGYLKSSGDYITLMCNDDYYTRPDAISILVKCLEENNADFSCGDTWWLNQKVWGCDINSFAYRHPFLINALLLKRNLIEKPPYYLDEKYKMCADYDLFLRLLTDNNVKGSSTKEVLSILRPGGFSQSSGKLYCDDTYQIYKKFCSSKLFSRRELLRLHYERVSLITYLKILLFCKNQNFKKSVKQLCTPHFFRKRYIKILEFFLFLKFITNWYKVEPKEHKKILNYTQKNSREWIETFYSGLY